MGSLVTGFTDKRSTFGRIIHKIKISTPWQLSENLLRWNKKKQNNFEKIKTLFFFSSQKNDKDEFNTILKHLIKLVKNF